MFKSPTSKCTRAFTNIYFCVISNTHGEELQKLSPPIFVNRISMVFIIVQPINHGRTLRYRHENFFVVAKTFLTKHVNHVLNLIIMINFCDTRGKNIMVKKTHFFLQRELGIDHCPHPLGLP